MCRRLAPCQCAQARHEAGADRAASVGHRRLLGGVDADQAEDRRGLPLRADPRVAARAAARAARPGVSEAAHVTRLIWSGPNGFFLRDQRQPQAAGVGHEPQRPRRCAFDTPGIDPALEGDFDVRCASRSAPTTRYWPQRGCQGQPAFAHLVDHVQGLFPRMGRRDLRRAGGDHPPHRQRIPRPRPGRRRRSRSKARRCPTARWRSSWARP